MVVQIQAQRCWCDNGKDEYLKKFKKSIVQSRSLLHTSVLQDVYVYVVQSVKCFFLFTKSMLQSQPFRFLIIKLKINNFEPLANFSAKM